MDRRMSGACCRFACEAVHHWLYVAPAFSSVTIHCQTCHRLPVLTIASCRSAGRTRRSLSISLRCRPS